MLETFPWDKGNLHTIHPAGYAFREKDKKKFLSLTFFSIYKSIFLCCPPPIPPPSTHQIIHIINRKLNT